MKRAAIYVRVSTQEQKKHGLSVDNQIDSLLKYCAENGHIVAGIYNDAGISARKQYTRRPALLQLLNDCEAGRVDLILFTRLDRWFRSVGDYYQVQSVLDRCRVPWRAIWEDYETETSSGVFKVNIMLSISQAEADRTSEKIKSVLKYQRESGDYTGGTPFGYIRVKNQLYIDEQKKPALDAMFATFLRTGSIARAMEAAAGHGLQMNRQLCDITLKNPIYAGEARNGYKSPAYITREEFDRISELRQTRTRTPKDRNRAYLFSGLLICDACGRRLCSNSTKYNHGERTCKYYNCYNIREGIQIHKRLSISEPKLEKYLIENIEQIIAGTRIRILKQNSLLDASAEAKRKKALEAKLQRVKVLFEEGDLDLSAYREKRDAIAAEILQIRIEPQPAPLPMPAGWLDIYDQLDDKHKRDFWHSIIKEIRIDPEKKSSPVIELL